MMEVNRPLDTTSLAGAEDPRAIKRLAHRLTTTAVNSADYSRRHLRLLCALSILIPGAYVIDVVVGQPYFDTLAIRLLAFLLVVPLMTPMTLEHYLGKAAFSWYFVGTATYILPFSYGLMLVLNAASAPPDAQIDMIWTLQYVVAIFLFVQLIHNGLLASLLWALSVLAVSFPLVFLDQTNWDELQRVMVYPVTGYLTALGFGLITNRNVDYVNAEKLRTASAIGGNIAHELRTPLASIRSLARSMSKYSEVLLDGYQTAKDSGLDVGELNQRQISGLRSALATIQREVDYSNTIIDMLLLNTWDGKASGGGDAIPSIEFVVRQSLSRFPFANSAEEDLVRVIVGKDFSVSASNILLTHVFFNLIKNAIYYAQKSPVGRVEIRIGEDAKPTIVVTDTGPGIPASRRRRVFERFYTTGDSHQGAGIGLSFCKMVMESIGGEIHCDSREGEYTTFRLVFPAVGQEAAAEH